MHVHFRFIHIFLILNGCSNLFYDKTSPGIDLANCTINVSMDTYMLCHGLNSAQNSYNLMLLKFVFKTKIKYP